MSLRLATARMECRPKVVFDETALRGSREFELLPLSRVAVWLILRRHAPEGYALALVRRRI